MKEMTFGSSKYHMIRADFDNLKIKDSGLISGLPIAIDLVKVRPAVVLFSKDLNYKSSITNAVRHEFEDTIKYIDEVCNIEQDSERRELISKRLYKLSRFIEDTVDYLANHEIEFRILMGHAYRSVGDERHVTFEINYDDSQKVREECHLVYRDYDNGDNFDFTVNYFNTELSLDVKHSDSLTSAIG